MEKFNNHIKCDVCSCMHNCDGKNCCLEAIKVTNGSVGCTCCNDYKTK